MSILLNDNLKIEAPKLIDERYGPHVNLAAALSFITPVLREMGLIFFVKDGINLLEYWWPTTDLSDGGIALRSYQPLDDDLTAIADLSDLSVGFLKKTAANTWILDNSEYSLVGHAHTFASITAKPTTVLGYGITDAYTKAEINNFFSGVVAITGYDKTNWDTAYGWGNHALAGYVKGVGVVQRIPFFSSTDTVTTSSRFTWSTSNNALMVNAGISGMIGSTLSGAFDGGSLQVWNGHEFAVMGSNVGNSGDVATMIMKSNKGISTNNGYIEIQGYYAGGTNTAPIIMQRQGGSIIIGGIAAGADTVSLLQVGGAIRQTSVTNSLLKASSTGVLIPAVSGTDYLITANLSGYIEKDKFIFDEELAGVRDGVNLVFTIVHVPLPNKLMVFKNGSKLTKGGDADYILIGNTITFHSDIVPLADDKLSATYIY